MSRDIAAVEAAALKAGLRVTQKGPAELPMVTLDADRIVVSHNLCCVFA
jgi:hypothetical protein